MRQQRFGWLRRRLSYANVMATLAFFFALTGGAMAANKYLQASDPITQGDLAGSTYGIPLIAAGKVTSGKIADGAITTSKFDSAAKAPNADKLDGLDSTAFLSGYQVVSHDFADNTPGDTDVADVVTCPAGKTPVGGGGEAVWTNTSGVTSRTGQLDFSIPYE